MKPRVVEEVADGVDHFVADAQDRLLPRRADPEMAAIHQVVDAVLFRRDRIVLRLGDDLEAGDVELEAAGRARVGADRAVDDEGAFPATDGRRGLNASSPTACLRHHALDEAGAVAQRQEMDLAARAAVVQPAAERDRLRRRARRCLRCKTIMREPACARSVLSRAARPREWSPAARCCASSIR